ncbi:hypothetical protein [uncultured Sphingomonas sp.]|uniref:hypothetical protein n=1 Tax=uncultured Sphingomonas sp. TaxID=158754 RepID=UPI0035CBBFDD
MPIVDGKTLIGWGVVREEPWDFVGLFETRTAATAKAINMGIGYTVRHGESPDDDSFVWKEAGLGGSAGASAADRFFPSTSSRKA